MGILGNIFKPVCRAVFLAFILPFAACEARIDINTSQAVTRLAVYGYVTTDYTNQKVTVHRTQGYFTTGYPDGVSGAVVYIESGKGDVYYLREDNEEPGTYYTEFMMAGKEGETYTLYVSADWDGDGETESYRASSGMLYGIEITRTELVWSENFRDHIELVMWGTVPEEQDAFFSFQISRNDDGIINDSLRNFSLFDGQYYNTSKVEALACYFLDQDEEDNRIYYGDEVTLHVGVLTREYGTFLKNARKEVIGSMPIFGGPPALVKGNIVQTAGKDRAAPVGFFSAFPITRHTTTYEE